MYPVALCEADVVGYTTGPSPPDDNKECHVGNAGLWFE